MKTSELQNIKQRYNIVGNCDALNHVLDVALQVAPTDLSVLIVGESGVGKEIIPRVIHDNSPRRREKYFAINCGSIPEGTIDSELFGQAVASSVVLTFFFSSASQEVMNPPVPHAKSAMCSPIWGSMRCAMNMVTARGV